MRVKTTTTAPGVRDGGRGKQDEPRRRPGAYLQPVAKVLDDHGIADRARDLGRQGDFFLDPAAPVQPSHDPEPAIGPPLVMSSHRRRSGDAAGLWDQRATFRALERARQVLDRRRWLGTAD